MRILFASLFAFLVCIDPAAAKEPAWKNFDDYRKALAADSQPAIHPAYLSNRLVDMYSQAEDELREQMRVMLGFPSWFARIDLHIEGRTEDGYCLTVNGYSDADEWLTAAIEYVDEGNRLVLNDVGLEFHEMAAEQPQEVQCPAKMRAPLEDL